jgi:hypothetical protein
MRHGFGVRQSVPYGLAVHYRHKDFTRHNLVNHHLTSTFQQHQSKTAPADLEDDGPAALRSRDRRVDEGRGGFVLTSRSDAATAAAAAAASAAAGGGGGRGGLGTVVARTLRLKKQRSAGSGDGDSPGGRGGGGQWRMAGTPGGSRAGSEELDDRTSTHTDSCNLSFISQDDVRGSGRSDVSVVETYAGEWKNDKRSGFGVCERTDGLKYEGEWFNNKKCGYGVTTFQDGSTEEGKYKENELVTSASGDKSLTSGLFTLRATKLRERIATAVSEAHKAAEIALQKTEIANGRLASARAKAELALTAANKARADAELARQAAERYQHVELHIELASGDLTAAGQLLMTTSANSEDDITGRRRSSQQVIHPDQSPRRESRSLSIIARAFGGKGGGGGGGSNSTAAGTSSRRESASRRPSTVAAVFAAATSTLRQTPSKWSRRASKVMSVAAAALVDREELDTDDDYDVTERTVYVPRHASTPSPRPSTSSGPAAPRRSIVNSVTWKDDSESTSSRLVDGCNSTSGYGSGGLDIDELRRSATVTNRVTPTGADQSAGSSRRMRQTSGAENDAVDNEDSEQLHERHRPNGERTLDRRQGDSLTGSGGGGLRVGNNYNSNIINNNNNKETNLAADHTERCGSPNVSSRQRHSTAARELIPRPHNNNSSSNSTWVAGPSRPVVSHPELEGFEGEERDTLHALRSPPAGGGNRRSSHSSSPAGRLSGTVEAGQSAGGGSLSGVMLQTSTSSSGGLTGSSRRLTLPSIIVKYPDNVASKSPAASHVSNKTTSPMPMAQPTKPDTYVIINGVRKRLADDVSAARTDKPETAVEHGFKSRIELNSSSGEVDGTDVDTQTANDLDLPSRYTLEPVPPPWVVPAVSTADGGGRSRYANRGSLPDVYDPTVGGSQLMSRQEAHLLSHRRREELRLIREEQERRKQFEVVLSVGAVKDWYSRQKFVLMLIAVNVSLAAVFWNMLYNATS